MQGGWVGWQTCLIYVYIERYIASSDFAPFSTPYIYSGLNAVAMYSVEFTLTDRRMQPTRLRYSPLFQRIPWQPCLSTTPLWIYQLLKAFMLMGMPMALPVNNFAIGCSTFQGNHAVDVNSLMLFSPEPWHCYSAPLRFGVGMWLLYYASFSSTGFPVHGSKLDWWGVCLES